MPPYLGQGACSGIRDAANLAWKLDLVLRGRAGESLLDTYELERRPHATVITHMSIGLGQIANMHDPEAAAQRDAAFKAGQAPPPPAMPTVTDGVVHHQPDGAVAPPAGSLVPQGRVTAGGRSGRFDDVVGRGFALVSTVDVASALTGEQRRFLDELGCRVVRLGTDVTDDDGVHTAYLAPARRGRLPRPARLTCCSVRLATPGQAGALVDELRADLAWAAAATAVGA